MDEITSTNSELVNSEDEDISSNEDVDENNNDSGIHILTKKKVYNIGDKLNNSVVFFARY